MEHFEKIEGLIAAVFTPYHTDGTINTGVVADYASRLKQDKLSGVFVNGSSGEGVLLSTDERKRMAEAWIPYGDRNFKVIVHVGSSSVEVAKDLAAHAERKGAYAISSMAPFFLASSDVEVVADYCRQVASAAPETPFYYYHLPVATGCHIKVNHLLERAYRRIPTLAGVKFTYSDLMDMSQCIEMVNGRFDVLHGHEELLINGLVSGIRGAIGTSFNFMPGVYSKIMEAYQNMDIQNAREYQMKSIRIIEVMLRNVNSIVSGKAIMKLLGLNLGHCRTPLRNLSSDELTTMKEDLDRVGFYELIN